MEKIGSCPRSPKVTKLTLGPRSLAGLMIHSQFLLVRFGMPIVNTSLAYKDQLILIFKTDKISGSSF